jgi:steroid delta-isomerase-like uncharacterized protein
MSAHETRETVEAYLEALRARGDYGRFFADEVRLDVMGTDQQARGAEAVEQLIRFLHEQAFDAQPELLGLLADERSAALEAVFAGTHTGEFAGVPASGNAVRVPYSVFYDVDAGRITVLRIYMAMDELLGQVRGERTAQVADAAV